MDDRAIGGAWHKPTVERTAEAARNAAAAEGLTLVRGGTGASGFLCVVASKGLYKATFMREDKRIHLGTFECAEAASLAVARNFPEVLAEASAKAAAKAAKETRPGLSLKDVERTAAAEGLVLWRDSQSKTGFRGVYREKPPDRKKVRFKAELRGEATGDHVSRKVGYFATAHEAALAIARRLGPEEAAARVNGPKRNQAGWVWKAANELSAIEAMAQAAEEGLTLLPADGSGSKFWAVKRTPAQTAPRWHVQVPVGVAYAREHLAGTSASVCGTLHLGSFASEEAGALALARRLRDDSPLHAHVMALRKRPRERRDTAQGRRPGQVECDGAEVDTRLWSGAYEAGWRVRSPSAAAAKRGHWRYVSPGGMIHRTRAAAAVASEDARKRQRTERSDDEDNAMLAVEASMVEAWSDDDDEAEVLESKLALPCLSDALAAHLLYTISAA